MKGNFFSQAHSRALLGPCFLLATLIVAFFQAPSEASRLWQIGFQASIFLGLLITFLSFQEISQFLLHLQEKNKMEVARISKVAQAFQAELKLTQKDLEKRCRMQEMCEEAVREVERELEQQRQAQELLQASLESSREGAAKLLDEFNEFRVAQFQQTLLNAQPEAPIAEEPKVETIDHRDIQLRQQFEEKSQVLHQTRRELFLCENELLALQKETEEKALEENPQAKILSVYAVQLEKECASLEAQIIHLEEIIADLLSTKKKATRPRKPRKKAEAASDLFSYTQ